MKFPFHKIVCTLLVVLYTVSINLMTISGDMIHEQGTNGDDTIYTLEPETSKVIAMVLIYMAIAIVLLAQVVASFLGKEKIVLYMSVFLFSISFIGLLPLLLKSYHGETYLLKEVPWQYYCFIVLQGILLVSTNIKKQKSTGI